METWIGTSGYNYPEWKGTFYPAKLAAAKMLPYYAERFRTVEINYTFYRMPSAKVLEGWTAEAPPPFRFTLKAPKRITHDRRLKEAGDLVRGFCELASGLGDRLAAILFQLPPNMKCHLDVFDAFLETLPPRLTAAFEFRHPSWHDEAVFARLRARNLALCFADTGDRTTPLVDTADYGYCRLRDEGYETADLERWAATIRARQDRWREAFVYFKHEAAGKGPDFAQRLMAILRREATGAGETPTPRAEAPTPAAEATTPAAEATTPAAEAPSPAAEATTPAAEAPSSAGGTPTATGGTRPPSA